MKGRETDDLGPSQPRVSLNTVGIASRSHSKRKRKKVYAWAGSIHLVDPYESRIPKIPPTHDSPNWT
jgi:hypothetical protein